MSSREHELDYADDPHSLRDPRRSSDLLVLLAVGAAALVLVLVVRAVVIRLMAARQAEAAAAGQAAVAAAVAAAPKVYDRDEFKAVVMAKSEETVIDDFGQPVRAVEDGERKYLYYRNLTKDPETARVDGLTALEFVRGRVAAVDCIHLANHVARCGTAKGHSLSHCCPRARPHFTPIRRVTQSTGPVLG
jgi:hypothetical protein